MNISNKEIHDNFLPFTKARNYVRNLNLKSTIEWKIWAKTKPNNIPSLPYYTYKKEWISWYDWLGYEIKIESYGIQKIKSILEINNIDYKTEKRYSNCKNKLFLPFDIFIPSINTIIEYDGEQHFYSVDIFGGSKSFKTIQKNDIIKNLYCKENNINLIRIPYTEKYNIFNILSKNLNITVDSTLINYKKYSNFINYNDAKEYLKDLNLKNLEEYRLLIKNNNIDFLPLYPADSYKDYISSKDFLNSSYFTYNEAKEFCITNNILTRKEYINNIINVKIPKSPDKYYHEWITWGNFFKNNTTDILLKKCSQCLEDKELFNSNKDFRKKDNYKAYCKDCGRKYYLKYKNKLEYEQL